MWDALQIPSWTLKAYKALQATFNILTDLDKLYTVWKPLTPRFQKCKIWFKSLTLRPAMYGNVTSIDIFWRYCNKRTKSQVTISVRLNILFGLKALQIANRSISVLSQHVPMITWFSKEKLEKEAQRYCKPIQQLTWPKPLVNKNGMSWWNSTWRENQHFSTQCYGIDASM